MPHYRISGLTVAADLTLPGAIPLSEAPDRADVRVGLRPVPLHLAAPTEQGPGWELDARRFLLALPGVGRFLATDGTTLDLDLAPGATSDDAMPFLLGTGLGALLYQRGSMVLHAAAVERNGGCIAVCAASGTGKSTLAAALCRMGCRLVSDDVTAVTLDPAGRPLAQPDGRCLKLFDAAIDQLDLATGRRGPVRTGTGKHYVEPPEALSAPAPLAAIYVMQDEKPPHGAGIERQAPLLAAQLLLNQSYRRRLALAMVRHDARPAAVTAAVLRHVPVFRLTRPRDMERLEETAAGLLDHWHGLGG